MRTTSLRLILLVLTAVLISQCPIKAADEKAVQKSLEMLRKDLRENNAKLADEFERRLNQSQQEVKQMQRGHVIFGRIQLEGDDDPRAVVSQMIILQDGFFFDAVGAVGKPVGFRLTGYESAIVTPEGPGPIEDLGTIQLKRLPTDRLCAATGKLQFESKTGAPKFEEVTIEWHLPADPINTPTNGTEGSSLHHRQIVSKIEADGTFSTKGMSPGKYQLFVRAPNCVQYFQPVEFTEGKTNELDAIRLEFARQMKVEFAVSKDGGFDDVEFQQTQLKADDRWRASKEVPEWGFDLLIGQKAGKLVLDYRYAPCHIMDLGACELNDELKIEINELMNNQPQSVPVEEGHVYVIFQSSWKHWILMRTTDVGAVGGGK